MVHNKVKKALVRQLGLFIDKHGLFAVEDAF